jgi:hypothetical protein
MTMTESKTVEEPKKEGAFIASLKRNNRQIKDARAEAIAEMAQMRYRRQVEDMENDVDKFANFIGNSLEINGDLYINTSPYSTTVRKLRRNNETH